MMPPPPSVLGLKKSFGFGDRLGLATPGHLAAANKWDFAPIFAQQSVREMERTRRTPQEVLAAAESALAQAQYSKPWGADADHHKTPEDIDKTAAAGFTFYTIDPSGSVNNDADHLSAADLEAAVTRLVIDNIFLPGWREEYLDQSFPVSESLALQFTPERLARAAVKYGRALAHCANLAAHIAQVRANQPFEIEVSVDETDAVTSPLDHLFCGLELKRRGVAIVSLAPRFVGEFEKGIDYCGNLMQFESQLRDHVAVARYCGPYKISIHSGSDKFSVYPIIGRVCGDLLHVKTAGTSYLEGLRVVARTAPALFAEIAAYCRGCFDQDRRSYHLSTMPAEIDSLAPFASVKDEPRFLDERVGRQLLHVTFGSVLTKGTDSKGRSFKDGILQQLRDHEALHKEVLEKHFSRHLALLNQG